MSHALPVFSADEVDRVQRLLALKVSQMMGRSSKKTTGHPCIAERKASPSRSGRT